MINYKIEKYFKCAGIVCVISIFIFIISLIIFRYEVEGEQLIELPFTIDKISIVSTADGIKTTEETEFLWSGKIIQVNDIYIKVLKNENINAILENVTIQNMEVTGLQKGNINFSKILKNEDTSNNYVIENLDKYKYSGDLNTSLEKLTIANQGGSIGIRTINNNLGTYNSNENEINYDGRILNLANINNEEIKFKLKFEILIEVLDGIKYRTYVELELPIGDIIENGVEVLEYENMENLVYKRYY